MMATGIHFQLSYRLWSQQCAFNNISTDSVECRSCFLQKKKNHHHVCIINKQQQCVFSYHEFDVYFHYT